MSSAFKSLMKRLFLSAAVKKRFVRLVSTLITSSESCGNSSRRGVGDGDGLACWPPPSFFADKLLLAVTPHNARKISRDKTNGRYCILNFSTALRCRRWLCSPALFSLSDHHAGQRVSRRSF